MKYLLVPMLIFSVIVVAGCSVPNVFGSDVLTVQTKTIENGVRDVITINDVQTIPKSPLLPDQNLLLSFVLENHDQIKYAHTYVDLFNAPTIKTMSGAYCNDYAGIDRTCKPLDNLCGYPQGCDVLPYEEKQINYQDLKTPSQTDIKNIKTDVKLNFKVGYKFSSNLSMLAPVVNMDEIVKRQRAGEKTDLTITKSFSSGPIQTDAELQGAQYIISNLAGTSPESVLLFTVRDRGSGDLVNSKINSGAMTIHFPPALKVSAAYTDGSCGGDSFAANDKFCCRFDAGTTCVNNRVKDGQDLGDIPLYLKESRASLRFAVSTFEPLQDPFRTVQITSDVDYDYEIRGSADVTINPFQNV